MPEVVSMGASIKCSFGNAPGTLIVLPINKALTTFMPAATTMDHIPFLNILPFGMCSSLANPMVAAATAAAFGVLTPMPCIPVTVSPWSPGSSKVKFCGKQALLKNAKCNCTWGGVIEISSPGQTKMTASG